MHNQTIEKAKQYANIGAESNTMQTPIPVH